MKPEKLSELLQKIDDNIISRTSRRRRFNKKAIMRSVAISACLALVLTLSIRFTQHDPTGESRPAPAAPMTEQQTDTPLVSKPSSVSKLVAGAIYPQTVEQEEFAQWSEYQKKLNALETSDHGISNYVSLLSQQTLKEDQNTIISPANVYFALTLLADVSGGNTQKQIVELLGYDSRDELVSNAKNLWQKLHVNGEGSKSVLANSLWLSNELEYDSKTVKRVCDELYASTFTGDFSSLEYTELLREWLNEQTGGLLKDSAQKVSFTYDTVFALASTIYYRAGWVNEFSELNTTTDTFYGKNGNKTADFMNKTIFDGDYYYSDSFGATRLSLDTGRMFFILPDEGVSISQVLEDDKLYELISAPEDFNQKQVKVNLSVPKFDVSSDLELSDDLKALGITDAFDELTADFSPILPDVPSFIGKVQHSARVKIDEKGCEAAAFTAIISTGSSMPPDEQIDFVLDRPFIFVITGTDSLPRFIGTVNNL